MIKRGQLTVFIVLGVLILFIVLGVFYISDYLKEERLRVREEEMKELQETTASLRFFVEGCLRDKAEEAIFFLGKQGGHYQPPEDSVVFFLEAIPYYYYEEEDLVPSDEEVEKEFSKYLEDKLDLCLEEFKVFKDQGFEIEEGEKEVKTKMIEDRLLIDLSYPLEIKKKGLRQELELFKIEVSSGWKRILNLSKQIVEMYEAKPGYVCLSCLKDLEIDEGKLVLQFSPIFDELLYVGEETPMDVLFVVFTDQLNGNSTFRYVLDFRREEEEIGEVELSPIPDLKAVVGEEFKYKVEARGKNIIFSDDADIFDIDPEEGIIKFTPTSEQAGKYLIKIMVEDEEGNSDFEIMYLEANE